MDKKYAKIIDTNLRYVTKALNVPKHNICSKCEFAFKTVKCSKTRHEPKECICFKTVKCSKTRHEPKVCVCVKKEKGSKMK